MGGNPEGFAGGVGVAEAEFEVEGEGAGLEIGGEGGEGDAVEAGGLADVAAGEQEEGQQKKRGKEVFDHDRVPQ